MALSVRVAHDLQERAHLHSAQPAQRAWRGRQSLHGFQASETTSKGDRRRVDNASDTYVEKGVVVKWWCCTENDENRYVCDVGGVGLTISVGEIT